ncbi:MAG: ABC transporter permease [Betaproteobacteria bacterium]|nr:ABC transporter permease [Betaproteobacteria bacterium]
MRPAALDMKLLRDMWRLRGHLVAVALVAACGVATFVTMRGAYEGLVEARDYYYAQYRFADVFAQAKRAPRSLVARVAALPGVATVQARIVHEVTLDVPGFQDPVTVRLISVPDDGRPALNDLVLESGRYVAPRASDEVMIGEAFALAHDLKPGDSVSAVINGRWQRLRVVGIANSPEYVYVIGGAAIFPDNQRFGVFWMSRKALEAALDMEDAFNDLTLRLAPGADEKGIIRTLDVLLAPYGATGAHGRDEQISNQMLDGEIKTDRVTGIVIPAIFLAVAAFLIHNVLMRLIALQRSQIGVLKSFGYSDRVVAWHYVKLAVGAALVGGMIGIALGAWLGNGLADIYQRFFHMPRLEFRLSAENLLGVTLVCVAAAVSGAWPAVRQALRMPPAEAMRPEPPARFKPLLVERLGYVQLLSPAARMLFRNVERRPMRAAFSALAIALACALLVVGRFSLDALDRTIRVQFEDARRDDVQVGFYEPRSAQVKYDLAKLPGVMAVEAFRVVPARLRLGHRSKRTALFGLPQGAELHRIVDIDGRVTTLPPSGVVLSAGLARILHARPGSVITVEILEGERRVREVPVASIVEEPLGLYAYLDERPLADLLGEDIEYSNAYLRVDPLHLDELYQQIKRLPVVSGVSLREATIRSFLATIAENIVISTTILIVFACVIAAGVVYNGARIALSEHAVTLASLRILGFTRREVTGILLGEQALLAAIGIPVGLVLGYAICAWMVVLIETELYRLPLAITAHTYLYAAGLVAGAAVVSGAVVAWRVRHLDLVAVLKTRE